MFAPISDDRRPAIRLFPLEPPAEGCAQDSPSCARGAPVPELLPFPEDRSSELFARVRDRHSRPTLHVPEADRPRIRRSSTLWAFWDEVLRPDRERSLRSGKVKKGTVDKERQVLRRFQEWDLASRPDEWPEDVAWSGLPIGYVSAGYLESFFAAEARRGKALGSLRSDWCHLRTVLNAAVKLHVLSEAPTCDLAEALKDVDRPDDEDLVPTKFSDAELEAIYRLLPTVELQVAFVVGANVGPRTEDLFALRWEQHVRLNEDVPAIYYRAVKTGKRHWVPVSPLTIGHLARLRTDRLFVEGPLFPTLTGHGCKDPGRSRSARRRNELIKAAMDAAGIVVQGDYERHWQVLRATCSSRLNNHRPGAGRLVTHGPDADVNSKHYWDYRDLIVEAILTLPQPAAFKI